MENFGSHIYQPDLHNDRKWKVRNENFAADSFAPAANFHEVWALQESGPNHKLSVIKVDQGFFGLTWVEPAPVHFGWQILALLNAKATLITLLKHLQLEFEEPWQLAYNVFASKNCKQNYLMVFECPS